MTGTVNITICTFTKLATMSTRRKKPCVFSVKELKSYIQKNAEAERENLAHLKDLDELEICYDGDGGGGRFVCEFAFINNIDRKITLHPFLIYEGTDCRENLEVTLGKLTPQFKQIEGKLIVVGGRRLKIHQFGLWQMELILDNQQEIFTGANFNLQGTQFLFQVQVFFLE